jgi:hypothetical protein
MKFNENISKNNWPEKKGETKTEKMSKWLLKINRDPYIENPYWALVQEYLKKMDGKSISMVLLRRKAKGEIVVHGGNLGFILMILILNWLIRQSQKKKNTVSPFPNYQLCQKMCVFLGII